MCDCEGRARSVDAYGEGCVAVLQEYMLPCPSNIEKWLEFEENIPLPLDAFRISYSSCY